MASTGLAFPPRSPEALATQTEHPWNDHDLCERLGKSGQMFARDKCTGERVVEHFRDVLLDAGLIAV